LPRSLSSPRPPRPAGTRLARDINPGSAGSYPYKLASAAGSLFFAADDGSRGEELWRSDGTARGTKIVRNIRPGSDGSSPSEMTGVGGTVFFSATDGVHGVELWRTDGTGAGTEIVQNIRPDSGGDFSSGSNPHSLTSVGGTLFFSADDGAHGRELWKAAP
jgi:ELWxxDGT repeat protein